jgi:putative transposase
LGLTAGPVPTRVEGPVKAGLLALIDAAVTECGVSFREACRWVQVSHARALGWRVRREGGGSLEDQPAGPAVGEAAHALLAWEKDAIVEVAKEWERIDLSHRKIAHRGSRLERVYVSESTVLRVLTEAGMRLPGLPRPEPRQRKAFPDWAELTPGVIWVYDFTHFSGLPGWSAIAIVDVVSRYCLALLLSPEETSTQVETAFIEALTLDGKGWLLEDAQFLEELASGHVPDPLVDEEEPTAEQVPVLLAVSDNGPQMTSTHTAQFMAVARIGQHFGRPGTPNDQAWIESFFGHLKTEHQHLDSIEDADQLRLELAALREHYNTVRLHEGIGYVTPDDEHYGRGEHIRNARTQGLKTARSARIAQRRQMRQNQTENTITDESN